MSRSFSFRDLFFSLFGKGHGSGRNEMSLIGKSPHPGRRQNVKTSTQDWVTFKWDSQLENLYIYKIFNPNIFTIKM